MAMREEAMPILDRFGLKLVDPPRFVDGAPFMAWMGDAGAVRLCVCWCGHDKRFGVNNVATTAAAVAAYAAVAAFGAPDLMISAGTAGATEGGAGGEAAHEGRLGAVEISERRARGAGSCEGRWRSTGR